MKIHTNLTKFFIWAFIAFILSFLAIKRTDNFTIDKVLFSPKKKNCWLISPLNLKKKQKIEKILSVPFNYLGRGRQSFVFESADKKYVIKLLNKKNLLYPTILTYLKSFSFAEKIINRKQRKVPLTFNSMKISYETLKKETMVKYVNLNNLDDLNSKILIISKNHIKYLLEPKDIIFVLQKKAVSMRNALSKSSDVEEKKKKISSFLDLIAKRSKKFVADDDLNSLENIGFIGNNAMIIDTGRLYIDTSLDKSKSFECELLRSTKFLKKFLHQKNPCLSSFLDKDIERIKIQY